jgi:putative salt-induced outer membrane protein
MRAHRLPSTTLLVLSCLLLASGSALAQEAPEGLVTQDPANDGTTDVASEGFQAVATDDGEKTDATEASIQAGGMFAGGNTKTQAATAATKFRMRRGQNQGRAAAAINWANTDGEDTAFNIQGMARYDRFVSKRVTLFLALNGRHDKFQDIDLRLNVDPGLAYYFIVQEKQSLWAEVGYDLEYEIRRKDAIDDAEAQNEQIMEDNAGLPMDMQMALLDVPKRTLTTHSVRLFLGYDNQLNEMVTFNTGVEYLQPVDRPEEFRVNWANSLTSQLGGDFSIALTFLLAYDNKPIAPKKTDLTASVNLVYTLI